MRERKGRSEGARAAAAAAAEAQKRVGDLSVIDSLLTQAQRFAADLAALQDRVNEIEGSMDPGIAMRAMELVSNIDRRVDALYRRHLSMVARIITSTELTWFTKRFRPNDGETMASAAIWALDRPDEWWAKRIKTPLGELVEDVLAEYRNRSAVELAEDEARIRERMIRGEYLAGSLMPDTDIEEAA